MLINTINRLIFIYKLVRNFIRRSCPKSRSPVLLLGFHSPNVNKFGYVITNGMTSWFFFMKGRGGGCCGSDLGHKP